MNHLGFEFESDMAIPKYGISIQLTGINFSIQYMLQESDWERIFHLQTADEMWSLLLF